MNDRKKQVGSLIFMLVLVALTFYFLFRNQDMYKLLGIIKEADPFYLCLGLFVMLLFLSSEAFSIWLMMKSLSFQFSFFKCLKYAFIGFFYCSITPTASGGPPMQVYYMKKDGAEISASFLAILIITVSYQIGSSILGLFMFLLRRAMILETIGLLKYFLLYGIIVNLILVTIFISLAFYKSLLHRLLFGAVRVLAKLKVIKKPDATKKKIEFQLEEYKNGLDYIKTHSRVLLFVFLSTVVQILSRLSVPFIVYKSFGLTGYHYLDILALQSILALAVDSLPLPGAIGAAESSFLLINRAIFGANFLFSAMLLSRGINFYAFLMISGIVAMVAHLSLSRRFVRKRDKLGNN